MENQPPYAMPQNPANESRFLPPVSPASQRWIVKLILIAVALLLFQIPLSMIGHISHSRSENAAQVEALISNQWGKEQVLTVVSGADNVTVSAVIDPEIRYRGIYHVMVYSAAVQLDFSYKSAPLAGKEYISLHDMNGLLSAYADINGEKVPLAVDGDKLQLPVANAATGCRVMLNFRGSRSLKLVPPTADSVVTVSGKWGAPFFGGTSLPGKRTVEKDAFSAEWHFNKFTSSNRSLAEVALLLPASPYLQCERLMKYATFFLVIFFCTMLCSEIISKVSIHPVQ